jgi:hypothetical protein
MNRDGNTSSGVADRRVRSSEELREIKVEKKGNRPWRSMGLRHRGFHIF